MEQVTSSVPPKRSFIRRYGSSLGFFAGMALLGFLAQFQWLGHIAIAIYAVVALKAHIPARVTFIAALLALAMVPVAIIFANWAIAQNFGAYAFVLFVLGVVNMTIDLQRELHSRK